MKKLLCIALSTVMLATSFASCAQVKPNSRITSSAGLESYAEFLQSRLGDNLPDRVYLGLPDENAEMTEFADDGYITRASEGDLVIYGKTAAGVDRAVRDYVKNGNPERYEKTYHEGYRVKKLSINGRDISDFTIVVHPFPEEYVNPDGVAKLALAATELQTFISRATGVTPGISEDTSVSPAIRLQIGDFEKYGGEAYSVEVKDGDLIITGGRYIGCLYGVYDFLEQDMNWRFLTTPYGGGTEYIYENEWIDITHSVNRFEDFKIKMRNLYDGTRASLETSHKLKSSWSTPGVATQAHHGLQNFYTFEDYNFSDAFRQPCFTDESIIEQICTQSMERLDNQVSSGLIPGYTLNTLDISQYDTAYFCECQNCLKVVREEGAIAGPVLRMTNTVADLVGEKYPEILVNTFAYSGTDIPPKKTVPRDNVKISYCFYVNTNKRTYSCSGHALNDPLCAANKTDADNFKRWCEISKYVDVWYYPFTAYYEAFAAPYFTTIYDSIKFLCENGVYGIFALGTRTEKGRLMGLSNYLCARLLSDDTMTEEEFYGYMREWFAINYGDAGDYLYELVMTAEYASNASAECWTSFASRPEEMVSDSYVKSNHQKMLDLIDKATSLADSSEQEMLIECLSSGYLYMIIGVFYDDMYVNGTEEQREWYSALYLRTHSVFRDNKISIFLEDGNNRQDFVSEEADLNVHPYDWYPYGPGMPLNP